MSPTREERVSLKLVTKNLNKEIKGIKNRTLGGLIEGARVVRYDMDKVAPVIPVDTGNLRQSFFTVTSKGKVSAGASPKFKGENAWELGSQHSAVKSNYLAKLGFVKEPTVVLGFSANYAMRVHESYGRHFRRPEAGAGFFVCSIYRNRGKIIQLIKEKASI